MKKLFLMILIGVLSFGLHAKEESATKSITEDKNAAKTEDAKADTSFSPYVDAKGNISLPEDFRKNMIHLGSWFVPGGEASGFHDVYADAATVDAYRKTGKFPDGAPLVKELRGHTTANYTTGKDVSYANEKVKQWFIMIKDTQGRFQDNPLWAEGWGWALFTPDDPKKNIATSFKKDCFGCHIPAKQKDWVYTEAYPTLGKPVP